MPTVMAMPIVTSYQYEEKFSRTSPFLSTANSRTPRNVPMMVPLPPNRLAPPSTTAAITSSSWPTMMFGIADSTIAVCTIAATPESSPTKLNTNTRVHSVLTPIRSAATSLPPMAKIARPRKVWRKMNQPTTNTASHITGISDKP